MNKLSNKIVIQNNLLFLVCLLNLGIELSLYFRKLNKQAGSHRLCPGWL